MARGNKGRIKMWARFICVLVYQHGPYGSVKELEEALDYLISRGHITEVMRKYSSWFAIKKGSQESGGNRITRIGITDEGRRVAERELNERDKDKKFVPYGYYECGRCLHVLKDTETNRRMHDSHYCPANHRVTVIQTGKPDTNGNGPDVNEEGGTDTNAMTGVSPEQVADALLQRVLETIAGKGDSEAHIQQIQAQMDVLRGDLQSMQKRYDELKENAEQLAKETVILRQDNDRLSRELERAGLRRASMRHRLSQESLDALQRVQESLKRSG